MNRGLLKSCEGHDSCKFPTKHFSGPSFLASQCNMPYLEGGSPKTHQTKEYKTPHLVAIFTPVSILSCPFEQDGRTKNNGRSSAFDFTAENLVQSTNDLAQGFK